MESSYIWSGSAQPSCQSGCIHHDDVPKHHQQVGIMAENVIMAHPNEHPQNNNHFNCQYHHHIHQGK